MPAKTYLENFEDGAGGWMEWPPNPLKIENGCAVASSPWWVDYNHAPPGGGYLHLLYTLYTTPEGSEKRESIAGKNRLAEVGFPTDWTNARVTVRIKGEMDMRGTQLVLLAQAKVGTHNQNHVLTGQPIDVTEDWSEQTITLEPDEDQWVSLGTRHDRTDFYGDGNIVDVLRDLNCDIIFVLHPLNVVPKGDIDGDPHVLRAGKDYEVDEKYLPRGHVVLDEIKIEFQ